VTRILIADDPARWAQPFFIQQLKIDIFISDLNKHVFK